MNVKACCCVDRVGRQARDLRAFGAKGERRVQDADWSKPVGAIAAVDRHRCNVPWFGAGRGTQSPQLRAVSRRRVKGVARFRGQN